MPTQSEYNQFRRLVGDFAVENIPNADIDSYLNDAVRELTADFVNSVGVSSPVTSFDTLVAQYRPEVIVWAAINWWWQKAADYADSLGRKTVGQASVEDSQRWEKAMEMINKLNEQYGRIQQLGTDITIGNLSRFSKRTLTRLGGMREEDQLG